MDGKKGEGEERRRKMVEVTGLDRGGWRREERGPVTSVVVIHRIIPMHTCGYL